MREHELAGRLRAAADRLPEPDLGRSTWERGRRARRRRVALGAGGGAAAFAAIGALVVLPGLGTVAPAPAGSGALPGAQPGSEQVIEMPQPLEASAQTGDEALQVWRTLYAACLEDLGYTVERRDQGLAASRLGLHPGEHDRDLAQCRAELVLDPPVQRAPTAAPEPSAGEDPARTSADQEAEARAAVEGGARPGTLDQPVRMALTARYHAYFLADRCLEADGLPRSRPPDAENFIQALIMEQLPQWHPYLEAARAGRYGEARDACPIG